MSTLPLIVYFLRLCCLVCVSFALSSCASRAATDKQEHKRVAITPATLQTSYDYAKAPALDDASKPAWILPVIASGWVPARVDKHTNQWISGHYIADIVEPGHWATIEEAELSGRPYILAGENAPVVPPPPRDSGSGNSRITAQGLPETNERRTPSDVSRDNQRASITLTGLGGNSSASYAPRVSLPDGPSNTSGDGRAQAWYVAESGEVFIKRGVAGTTAVVDTPHGPVEISFRENGRCSVLHKGKTANLVIDDEKGLLRVKLTD